MRPDGSDRVLARVSTVFMLLLVTGGPGCGPVESAPSDAGGGDSGVATGGAGGTGGSTGGSPDGGGDAVGGGGAIGAGGAVGTGGTIGTGGAPGNVPPGYPAATAANRAVCTSVA